MKILKWRSNYLMMEEVTHSFAPLIAEIRKLMDRFQNGGGGVGAYCRPQQNN